MTAPGDLDALIRRLHDAASSLDADQPPIAPPIGDWHQRLTELRNLLGTQSSLFSGFDPQLLTGLQDTPHQPPAAASPSSSVTADVWRHSPERFSLSVLMAPDADDAVFIDGLYQHLLGRAADAEGKANYLHSLSRRGRLFVLGEFLQSPEATQALDAQPEKRIQTLRALRDTWRRYHPPGRISSLTSRLLNLAWQGRARWAQRRWRHQSQHAHQQALWAEIAAQGTAQQQLTDAQQQLTDALCKLDQALPAWYAERYQLATAVLEMDDRQRHFGQRQDHEYARQQALWQLFAAWRRTATAPAPHSTETEATPEAPTPAAPSELDAYYLAFEAAFRGPEADIAAHLNRYRDAWTRARQAGNQALDLGCGRGEWLRLLSGAGFQPRGIDLNASMVDYCREQGFKVKQQDALEALGDSADASLALISGFHIAEHLPFEVLFSLVAEAYRTLAPGGVLVLETPNPENLIVASYSFYHDLTHRNPLTPPTLQFLLQFHGFGDTSIQRFNPPPDDTRVPGDSPSAQRLNAMLAAPMDYALIGTKAALSANGDAAAQQNGNMEQAGGKHP